TRAPNETAACPRDRPPGQASDPAAARAAGQRDCAIQSQYWTLYRAPRRGRYNLFDSVITPIAGIPTVTFGPGPRFPDRILSINACSVRAARDEVPSAHAEHAIAGGEYVAPRSRTRHGRQHGARRPAHPGARSRHQRQPGVPADVRAAGATADAAVAVVYQCGQPVPA